MDRRPEPGARQTARAGLEATAHRRGGLSSLRQCGADGRQRAQPLACHRHAARRRPWPRAALRPEPPTPRLPRVGLRGTSGRSSAVVPEHFELSGSIPSGGRSARFRVPPAAVAHPKISERPVCRCPPCCTTPRGIIESEVSPARRTDLVGRRVVTPRRFLKPVVTADRTKKGLAAAHPGCAFQ